jgi:RimJ/RimL family protein N-acetyltransferase
LAGAPTIETPRLILRGWRDADLEPWVLMHADPHVTEFFARTYTREVSESAALAMRTELERNGYGWWIAEIKDGRRFAGSICLRDVPFEARFTPAREIGWRLAFESWGLGYATEGAAAALDFAFRHLRWNEVVAMTSVLNRRSQRVMERLHMTRDPRDDFDHPMVKEGDRLRPHLLYRARNAQGRRI